MNLLTLQICKEEAEQMLKDCHSWLGMYRLSHVSEKRIREQAQRTLDVIDAYERTLKWRKK